MTKKEIMNNHNSSINQTVKGNLVAREIYCNVSMMVDNILQMSFNSRDALFNYDDIENYYNDASEEIEEIQDEIDDLHCQLEEAEENDDDILIDDISSQIVELESQVEELEDWQNELPEIYEWYMVSNYFAEELKAKGECILYGNIWGRQGTGQAVLLDYVIGEIACDREILEGQENHQFWV